MILQLFNASFSTAYYRVVMAIEPEREMITPRCVRDAKWINCSHRHTSVIILKVIYLKIIASTVEVQSMTFGHVIGPDALGMMRLIKQLSKIMDKFHAYCSLKRNITWIRKTCGKYSLSDHWRKYRRIRYRPNEIEVV